MTTLQPQPNPNMKMPKWLIYGLIAKGVLVVTITVGVLWWVGVLK